MNNEKIIDRIKKLLAMATHDRGNHYECEVAMKMAHRLMAEHKISEAQLNTSDKEIDCEYRSIVVKKKDHKTKLLAFIAWIMSEFFQTEVYSRPAEAIVVSTKNNSLRRAKKEGAFRLPLYIFIQRDPQSTYA